LARSIMDLARPLSHPQCMGWLSICACEWHILEATTSIPRTTLLSMPKWPVDCPTWIGRKINCKDNIKPHPVFCPICLEGFDDSLARNNGIRSTTHQTVAVWWLVTSLTKHVGRNGCPQCQCMMYLVFHHNQNTSRSRMNKEWVDTGRRGPVISVVDGLSPWCHPCKTGRGSRTPPVESLLGVDLCFLVSLRSSYI
jgi:hypothetical protein